MARCCRLVSDVLIECFQPIEWLDWLLLFVFQTTFIEWMGFIADKWPCSWYLMHLPRGFTLALWEIQSYACFRFYHLMTTGSRLHWLLSYETHSWRWRIKRRRLKQWNEVRTRQLFVMHNNCVIFILFFLRELEKVMAFLKYTYYEGKA